MCFYEKMASTSGISFTKHLRSDDDQIFLVGKCENQIIGAKLPSMKQTLQLFFYKIRMEKMNAKQSFKYRYD